MTDKQRKNLELVKSGFANGISTQLATKQAMCGPDAQLTDKEKQVISFPDLTFDIDTKNKLLKSAAWLFDDLITDKIREAAIYDLKNDLKNNKTLVEKELNRDLDKNIRMATTISSIVIDGIYPMNNELLIQSSLIGELKILVK